MLVGGFLLYQVRNLSNTILIVGAIILFFIVLFLPFNDYGILIIIIEVIINPDASSIYTQTIVENVTVVNGEITIIEEPIQLNLKTGSITGKITNPGLSVTASITIDGTEKTATTDANGVFLLEEVPVGTYSLTLTPSVGDIITITDIVVQENTTQDLGEITFP